jgi:IS5 family transposase
MATQTNRITIFDDRGRDTGATFGVEPRGGVLTIRYDSRGTTAGTKAYRAGLVLLLERLAAGGYVLDDAVVDTARTRAAGLSRSKRRLIAARPFDPAAAGDLESVRKAWHTAAAKVGRPEGAKGGGNGTKRLRLYVAPDSLTPPSRAADVLTETISRGI